jgi:DNA-binding CsgD family transcriptional regulator
MTMRQKQCLQLAAAGLDYQEIGARLWVSGDTVRSHLTKARRALGAVNTTHAVALAVQQGIVRVEQPNLEPA